jgi:predicted transcriptional regulator
VVRDRSTGAAVTQFFFFFFSLGGMCPHLHIHSMCIETCAFQERENILLANVLVRCNGEKLLTVYENIRHNAT